MQNDTRQQDRFESAVLNPDTSKIIEYLNSGRQGGSRSVLNEFFDASGYDEQRSAMLRQYIVMSVYLSAGMFAGRLGVPGEAFFGQFGTADDVIIKLQERQSAVDFLTPVLEQCLLWRTELCSAGKSAEIEKAIEYMRRGYSDESISLQSVALEVNLSPSYFSAQFKKYEGVSFVDYLNTLRISKAKELLCCTLMHVSEIAFAVGYNDYRYFSRVFKKQTGQTPRGFRRENNRPVI